MTLLVVNDANGNPAVIIPNAQATLLTDYSGTITTGGTAQQLMPANANRSGWIIQNQHATATLEIYELGTPSSWGGGSGAIMIAPGAFYPNAATSGSPSIAQITVYSATVGHPFAARQW